MRSIDRSSYVYIYRCYIVRFIPGFCYCFLLRFCLHWEFGFDFALFIENASHFRFSITTTLLLFVLLLLLLLLLLLADYYYFSIFLFSMRVCACGVCVCLHTLASGSHSLPLALSENNAICCCLTRTFVVAFDGDYTY